MSWIFDSELRTRAIVVGALTLTDQEGTKPNEANDVNLSRIIFLSEK
jgi:hypothetical protein